MNSASTKQSNGNKITSQNNKSELNESSFLSSQNVYEFKIILLGDVAVGKTSIMNRFIDNTYNSSYYCTIGVDFKVKSLKISNTTSANLKIWDTCGQEKFRSITRQYYSNTNGICLVYDLTNKNSFEKLDNWIQDIKNIGLEDILIFIVGNKLDSSERKMYLSDEAKRYAKNSSLEYIEVSAKNGKNIIPLFELMTKRLIQLENYKNKNKKKDDDIGVKPLSISERNNIVVIKEKNNGCC